MFVIGNVKMLAYKVIFDNKMFCYFNNNNNWCDSFNENYVWEFFEFFIIFKGLVQGIGDYINYIEEDIKQVVCVFIGFDDEGFDNKDLEIGLAIGWAIYNWYYVGFKIFFVVFGN